jgi:hypothetical protein
MARAKREGVTTYLLRDVPTKDLEKLKARAQREGLSARDVLVSAVKAFNRGELAATEQK